MTTALLSFFDSGSLAVEHQGRELLRTFEPKHPTVGEAADISVEGDMRKVLSLPQLRCDRKGVADP